MKAVCPSRFFCTRQAPYSKDKKVPSPPPRKHKRVASSPDGLINSDKVAS